MLLAVVLKTFGHFQTPERIPAHPKGRDKNSMPATVKDTEKAFADARIQSRREDQIAMSTGKASPAELQQKNSILPENFWSEAKVNWSALAIRTKSHS